MAEFKICTLIETADDEEITPEIIRIRIDQDLNRGSGLYMDVGSACTIERINTTETK